MSAPSEQIANAEALAVLSEKTAADYLAAGAPKMAEHHAGLARARRKLAADLRAETEESA